MPHKGYTTPKPPIQDQAISPILEGRDLKDLPQPAQVKTAAFLIPLIQRVYTTRAEEPLSLCPQRAGFAD